MGEKPAIELRNITKTFGHVVANKNVSLTVNRGEILSILGENGSGKTTLKQPQSLILFIALIRQSTFSNILRTPILTV